MLYGLYTALTRGFQKALVADLVLLDNQGAEVGPFHRLVGLVALLASLLASLLYIQVLVGASFYFSATYFSATYF